MKKIFMVLMFVPLFGLSQTKNISSTYRIFPIEGKSAELEKALTAHVQKFHTTSVRWRVLEIQTGPDAGGYQINEGPGSWEDFDKREKNSDAHSADWSKTVAIYISKSGTTGYVAYNEEYSTVQLTDYSDKIILNHMFIKPGMVGDAMALMAKMKKPWADGNESMAVYTTVASGEPQIITSRRLKGGLKELDPSFNKPMPERYRAANGADSWGEYLEDYARIFSSRWSEMLLFRADLSSK
jgi:hypothetical protein